MTKIAQKIKSNSKVRIEGSKENESCSTILEDTKTIFEHKPTPKIAWNWPKRFKITPKQLYLNSTKTKRQLNLNHKSVSTSTQPQPKLNLNLKSNPGSSQPQLNFSFNLTPSSTSTITSTQYGCDIKATQSCYQYFSIKKSIWLFLRLIYSNNFRSYLIRMCLSLVCWGV